MMSKFKKTLTFLSVFVVLGGVVGMAEEYVQTRIMFCYGDCSPPEAVIEVEEMQFMRCKTTTGQSLASTFDLVCIIDPDFTICKGLSFDIICTMFG